jgi:hypothetical protein
MCFEIKFNLDNHLSSRKITIFLQSGELRFTLYQNYNILIQYVIKLIL